MSNYTISQAIFNVRTELKKVKFELRQIVKTVD